MEFYSCFLVNTKELIFRITNLKEIPLGFNGVHDGSGYHIGYKMLDTSENLTLSDDEGKILVGDYLFDLSAGTQLIFV